MLKVKTTNSDIFYTMDDINFNLNLDPSVPTTTTTSSSTSTTISTASSTATACTTTTTTSMTNTTTVTSSAFNKKRPTKNVILMNIGEKDVDLNSTTNLPLTSPAVALFQGVENGVEIGPRLVNWLRDIEQYFVKKNIECEEKKVEISRQFIDQKRGNAFTLLTTDPILSGASTWAEFKSALILLYLPKVRRKSLAIYSNLISSVWEPNEGLKEFFSRLCSTTTAFIDSVYLNYGISISDEVAKLLTYGVLYSNCSGRNKLLVQKICDPHISRPEQIGNWLRASPGLAVNDATNCKTTNKVPNYVKKEKQKPVARPQFAKSVKSGTVYCLNCETQGTHHTSKCRSKPKCGYCQVKGHQRGSMPECQGQVWTPELNAKITSNGLQSTIVFTATPSSTLSKAPSVQSRTSSSQTKEIPLQSRGPPKTIQSNASHSNQSWVVTPPAQSWAPPPALFPTSSKAPPSTQSRSSSSIQTKEPPSTHSWKPPHTQSGAPSKPTQARPPQQRIQVWAPISPPFPHSQTWTPPPSYPNQSRMPLSTQSRQPLLNRFPNSSTYPGTEVQKSPSAPILEEQVYFRDNNDRLCRATTRFFIEPDGGVTPTASLSP